MGSVKWYDDDPPGNYDLDVSLWHPYSAPPVEREGGWNFSASPLDLFNIGKYIWDAGKKLFGGGGADSLAAAVAPLGKGALDMVTPGVAPSSIDSLLAATGNFPSAAIPALPSLPGVGSTLSMSPDTLLGALGYSPTTAVTAPTVSSAMPSLDTILASETLPTSTEAATTAAFPGLGVSMGFLLPAGLALADMFTPGGLFGDEKDPWVAWNSAFGVGKNQMPTKEALQEYLDADPLKRKVPLLDTAPSAFQLGLGDTWIQKYKDLGMMTPEGRWSSERGVVSSEYGGEGSFLAPTGSYYRNNRGDFYYGPQAPDYTYARVWGPALAEYRTSKDWREPMYSAGGIMPWR